MKIQCRYCKTVFEDYQAYDSCPKCHRGFMNNWVLIIKEKGLK